LHYEQETELKQDTQLLMQGKQLLFEENRPIGQAQAEPVNDWDSIAQDLAKQAPTNRINPYLQISHLEALVV
jgi:hypothetical protein